MFKIVDNQRIVETVKVKSEDDVGNSDANVTESGIIVVKSVDTILNGVIAFGDVVDATPAVERGASAS